jgi:hypothetical protein
MHPPSRHIARPHFTFWTVALSLALALTGLAVQLSPYPAAEALRAGTHNRLFGMGGDALAGTAATGCK